ncbi:hypothetical protein QYE76_036393 [Lolium multiflorum]|uniref:Receptor ligand binding region domain-containing protein n=1 Tax=Lolium multiflorum TaxID=4521 RepID=A0AAD8R0U9_LOLMU|nr:hypothetical protein QYE76_036393 [Lolium multiflorum]
MIKLHPLSRSRIERPTRRSLIFLSLLGLWSTAAAAAAAEAVAASVRVGVVLDLRSEVGRKRRACISMALHDFELKHPSYATRVELYVMDSRGEAATTAHAAEDLIKNVRAHAIIWGPHTLTKEDHVSHLGRQSDHNHIPVISYSSTSPASCTFWIEDPVKASGGHPKFGFTLGSDSITFLNLKTDKRNGANLDCEGPRMKIAVPEKQGFKEFVDTTDPNNITGYSIDIFKASMETLYPIPCYDYSVFQGGGSEIEEKWFGRFSPPIGVGTDSDSGPLTLQSFSGLFVITGSISTLMLLISIARRLYAKFTSLGMADYTDVDDDSDPLQNGMGNNPDPDQQPISEVDNDDLQGVRADGQNAQEEAPGPVQHNGTNGGSLPAEHIQIQMGTI